MGKRRRRPGSQRFRGSMAGLYAPLPTLRRRPRGRPRTARGRCGSLLLHRSGLTWAFSGQVVRFFGTSKKLQLLFRYPRSEPYFMTWLIPHQIKLTSGRHSKQLHQYPAFGGWGSGGRDHSFTRLFKPVHCSVPIAWDPSGPVRSRGLEGLCWSVCAQMVFIAAPSMTTPLVEYFHNATRSLRASATIVVLRILPPLLWTRSWNQTLSAEVGWCRSHSHASCIIVVRSRRLPALETPCS